MAAMKNKDLNKILGPFGARQRKFMHMPENAVCDSNINVGPGQYDPKDIEKHK